MAGAAVTTSVLDLLGIDPAFDPRIPCETTRRECDAEATKVVRWKCGCIQLVCAPCAASFDAHDRQLPPRWWLCCFCRADFGFVRISDCYRIEPL